MIIKTTSNDWTFNDPCLCLFQDNKISFWSIGNHGILGMEDGFEGEPQLLCEHKHDGDVLDLQVSHSWRPV